ncbi:MAG: Xaa-Pro peptidase family protein [Candidatus Omnitrophota bacterium]|nr:Xaa-Pro peptidase family protein [Candidatus Omnitrophota bacterium]
MIPPINQALEKIKLFHLDGLLVTKDVNVSYLTDFDSSESWLLLHPQKTFYITDFRYIEEAKEGLRGIYLKKIKGSIFKDVFSLCSDLAIKRLGVESRNLSLAEYQKLKSIFKDRIEIIETHDFIESLRQIKTEEEILKIRQAIKITAQAFSFLKHIIKPGLSEYEAMIALEGFIRKKDARLCFDAIIASGSRGAYPHAKVTKLKFQLNEPVTVDIGVDFKGYKSDLTRVFFLGKIPAKVQQIYKIVLLAQERAIKSIKPGKSACEIDACARNYLSKYKLGRFFGHSLGHGVGREVHESPAISSKNDSKLEKNMVFTVEPAVYLPGEFGIRIEDMVLVKEKACEVLSGFIHKSA